MKRIVIYAFFAFLCAASLAQSATTAVDGNKVTFSVAAKGTAPFTYQWRKNGVAIAGATAATYVVATARPADSGLYSVVVSNSAGSATSGDVQVTVTAAAPSGVVIAVEVVAASVGTPAP